MENTPEITAVDGGLPRRTVLAGAAWTIPVIAAATITPTASASGTLQLAFDKTTYNGTACSTITGAYVTATTNGTPTTGASITVSLSNNYTFAGGSTTATGLSGANGRYTLPNINVPSMGGNATLQATSSSASATATAQGTPAPATVTYYSYSNVGGIPNTATITDVATCYSGNGGHWAVALTSDGTIYRSLDGSTFTAFDTNITHVAGADASCVWAKSDNTVGYYSYTNVGGIPTTATITDVATCYSGNGGHWAVALTSDGTIYRSLDGSTFTAFDNGATHLGGADATVIWAKSDNTVTYYTHTNIGGIPNTATITDVATCYSGNGGHWAVALTSDGTIYRSLDGSTFTAFDTNITHIAGADASCVWAKSDNTVGYYSYTNVGGIPTTATITDVATCEDDNGGHYAWALTSDGALYQSLDGATFATIDTNVTHIAASDRSNVYSKTKAC